jgi:hypothetical protein
MLRVYKDNQNPALVYEKYTLEKGVDAFSSLKGARFATIVCSII